MSEQLKPYFSNHFRCDSCQKEFWRTTAYAPDFRLKITYCANCLETKGEEFCSFSNQKKCLNPLFNKKKQLCRSHYYQVWKKLNRKKSLKKTVDKRITGRTKQLNLKVKEQTYWKLKELALKNGCLLTEALEKVLEEYGKTKKTK